MQPLFSAIGHQISKRSHRLVGGDLRARKPGAGGVAVEIIARQHLLIHGA
jgi:hypothetical protein